jgi:transcription elongation factor Elf1
MTRVRPVWIPERVPARITCMQCGSPLQASFADDNQSDGFRYKCQACGRDTVVSLEQLNDPTWRPKLMGAKAS